MSEPEDINATAYEAVQEATGGEGVDASEFEGGRELSEKLRRLRGPKLVGYGPDGLIYAADPLS